MELRILLIILFCSCYSGAPPRASQRQLPAGEPVPLTEATTSTTTELELPTTILPPTNTTSNTSLPLNSTRTADGGSDPDSTSTEPCPYSENIDKYTTSISKQGFNLTRSAALLEANQLFGPLQLLNIINQHYDECFELFIKSYKQELLKKNYTNDEIDSWIAKWRRAERPDPEVEESEEEEEDNEEDEQDEEDDDDFYSVWEEGSYKNLV